LIDLDTLDLVHVSIRGTHLAIQARTPADVRPARAESSPERNAESTTLASRGCPRRASLGVPSLFAQRLGSPNRDVRQTTIQRLLTRSLPRSQQRFIQARRCPSPVEGRTQTNQYMGMIMTTISRAARRDNVAGCILTLGTALRNARRRHISPPNHGLEPALEHLGRQGEMVAAVDAHHFPSSHTAQFRRYLTTW
jgi:hypothetical protein